MKKNFIIFLILLAPVLANAQVDLIWEAQTYTPPSYAGRSLATAGSLVKVVAHPASGRATEGNLTFYWRKDGLDIKSANGVGHDTFSYRASDTVGSNNLIEVVAVKADGVTSGSASARIPVVAPKIIFYEIRDGQVDYRHALGQLNIKTDQTKIIAEPFYFSLPDWQNRRLTFNWSMNGEKIVPATEDPRFLTFLTGADSGVGERVINLKVANDNRQFQTASAKLPISFGLSSFSF